MGASHRTALMRTLPFSLICDSIYLASIRRLIRSVVIIAMMLSATVVPVVPAAAAVAFRVRGVKMKQINFLDRNLSIHGVGIHVFLHKNTPQL